MSRATRPKPGAFPELLTGFQCRELAGITATSWCELLETGRLPKPVLIDDRYKWRKADILAWIKDREAVDVFA